MLISELLIPILSIVSFGLAGYCVAWFATKYLRGEYSFYLFAMLGYGVFGFFDVARSLSGEGNGGRTYTLASIAVGAWVLVSAGVFCLGYYSVGKRHLRLQTIQSYEQTKLSEVSVAVLALLLGTIFYIQPGLHTNPYFAFIAQAAKAAALVLLYVSLMNRRFRYLLVVAIVFTITTVESSRRAHIAAFIPMFLIVADYYTDNKRSLSKAKQVMAVGLLSIALVGYLLYIRRSHDFGGQLDQTSTVGFITSYATSAKYVDTFNNSVFLFESIPEQFPHLNGSTYFSVLVAPIPRSIWPSKPVSLSSRLGLMQAFGVSDYDEGLWLRSGMFSLSPGLVGEAWANFGALGVLGVSLIFGTLCGWGDHLGRLRQGRVRREVARFLPLLPWYGAALLMLRGDFYTAVNFPLMLSVFIWLSLKVAAFRPKPSRRAVSARNRAEMVMCRK